MIDLAIEESGVSRSAEDRGAPAPARLKAADAAVGEAQGSV
ncbi:hypothetical protein [Streptomyces sp. SID3212]|nr:hypothetical protein [Streptomyces sp. SID3212]